MQYLLDTNHCSYIMNGTVKNPMYRKSEEINALAKYKSIISTPIYMCEVSLSELCYGAEKSSITPNIYNRIATFRALVPCLSLTTDCWELHGKVKWEIKKSGNNIADFDLLIACVAKTYSCIFVTNDTNFNNLPSGFIQIENWAS